jgi:mRNA interferase MazF
MDLVTPLRRYDLVLVQLDPTVGAEMQKTRPCMVVSPDEMNRQLSALIVAPMTTGGRTYATRVPIRFRRRDGHVALDQIRAVDRSRIVSRMGAAERGVAEAVAARLVEMFAY